MTIDCRNDPTVFMIQEFWESTVGQKIIDHKVLITPTIPGILLGWMFEGKREFGTLNKGKINEKIRKLLS